MISSAIALTGIMFGPASSPTHESVDQPAVSTGFKESPRRLNYPSPTADLNQPIVAAQQTPPRHHPPIVGPNFVSADPIPAPIPRISVPASSDQADFDQTNFDQANFDQANFDQANFDQANFDQPNFDQPDPIQAIRIEDNWSHEKSDIGTPERATLIPQRQLPGLNEDPNTAPLAVSPRVSQRQALSLPKQPSRSVLETQLDSKSLLEEHYSTTRPKYIENRYVNSDGQPTLASRVLALERNSLTRGQAETPHDQRWQEPTSVGPANYESHVSDPSMSVLISDTIPLEQEVASAFHRDSRIAPSKKMIDPAMQQAAVPTQIAPTNRAMGMSMQQPVLPRLRVNPQVEARAREHIDYGESLARRNSYMAAREEFALALLMIARSHKAQSGPSAYSNRLAQGLTALDEAEDLIGLNNERSQDSVFQQKVRSHKTRLISPDDIGNISATRALDYYFGYAQSQIEQAIGHSAAGSAALHALGKIESRNSENNRRGDWTGQARSLVFFRAAMNCNPANAVCSNDLGVMLHNMGRLKEAEHAFKASLNSSPTRLGWANLAAVHSQLAVSAQVADERDRQMHLARTAAMQAERYGSGAGNGIAGEQWATTNEFHNNAAFPSVTTQPVPESRQQISNLRKVSTAETLRQKINGWN